MTRTGARAALYLRISKVPSGSLTATLHEGEISYSVEDQEVRCRALCDAEGYEIVSVFYDDGISAYRSLKDRPGYDDLTTAVTAGKFDVLVFDRQDRLARDKFETMQFMVICGRAGIVWHSVTEGLIDLSESMQMLFAVFRGADAESYSRKISENARRANAAKRDKGLPGAGQRPFGYKQDKIEVEPKEARLIERGTQMALRGRSKTEVARMFRESGIQTVRGNQWTPPSVVALLKRWRNAGYVEHNGEPHGVAVWNPIVSLDEVKQVRAIFAAPKVPGRWKTPTNLLSGIIHCQCGLTMVTSSDSDGSLYRCRTYLTAGKGNARGHV
ncbi:MAG: recombinase family protein, partial [Actinomycetota bacterium]|nr:recombinase family protein [Actinomycetota bacterium]